MDLDWTENSWKCWIGMRNGLGMGWTGLIQNIRTGFWTVPNYEDRGIHPHPHSDYDHLIAIIGSLLFSACTWDG